MRQKVLWSVAAVLVAAGTLRASDANDVKAGLEKRMGQLKNVVVAYEFKVVLPPLPAEELNRNSDGRSIRVEVGAERQLKFYHLDGKVRYESKEKNLPKMPQSDGTGTMVIMEDIANSTVEIVADGTKELLCGYRDNAYFKGFIRKAAGGEDNDAIAGPLGMRVGGRWVDAQTVAACKVTVGRPSGGHTMEIARADGGYEKWVLLRDYSPAIQEVVSADGVVQSRTETSDYRNVGDLMIAYKAVKTEFGKGKDGKPIEGDKYVFTVKSCEIGSKENVPALYKMVWPDEAIVTITDQDGKKYEAKGKDIRRVDPNDPSSERLKPKTWN